MEKTSNDLGAARALLVNVLAARTGTSLPDQSSAPMRRPSVKRHSLIPPQRPSFDVRARVELLVRKYLRRKGVCCVEMATSARTGFKGFVNASFGEYASFPFRIEIQGAKGWVWTEFKLPARASSSCYTSLADLCARINAHYVMQGRMVVARENEGPCIIWFERQVPAEAFLGPDSSIYLASIFDVPLLLFGRFCSAFAAVILGVSSAQEAFELCSMPSESESAETAGKAEEKAPAVEDVDDGETNDHSPAPTTDYLLDGVNVTTAGLTLEQVVGAARRFVDPRTRNPDAASLTMLLSGPPGTGKTAFVEHLGRECKRTVVTIKGSDVLDRYVGGTEQKIADAFEQAIEKDAILFIDEVDGLLARRDCATQNWQISQTTQLLQEIESFHGVFVAATNRVEDCDPAMLRRFALKLQFGFLDSDGTRLFFERFFHFGQQLTRLQFERLEHMRYLAPGDFKTVRTKLALLAEKPSVEGALTALEAECAAKIAEGESRRIGF